MCRGQENQPGQHFHQFFTMDQDPFRIPLTIVKVTTVIPVTDQALMIIIIAITATCLPARAPPATMMPLVPATSVRRQVCPYLEVWWLLLFVGGVDGGCGVDGGGAG